MPVSGIYGVRGETCMTVSGIGYGSGEKRA